MTESQSRFVQGLIMLLGVFAVATVLAFHNITDGDLWAKLAIGSSLWNTGHLLRHDVYAFTPTLPQYIDHEWGAGVVFYTLLHWFGPSSLIVLRMMLALGLLTLGFWAGRREGCDANILLLLAVPAAACILTGYIPVARSHVFTFFLFAATLFCLEEWRRGRRWPAAVLPPLILVWTNLHGGFVVGLAAIFIYTAASVLTRDRAGLMISIAVACALVTLINPYRLDFWRYLIPALLHPRLRILEWRPLPPLAMDDFWGFRLLFILTIIAIAAGWKSVERKNWPGLTVFAMTAIMGWRSRRHGPFLAATALTYVGPYFQAVWAQRFKLLPVTGLLYAALALWVAVCFLPGALLYPLAPIGEDPVREVDILALAGAKGNAATPFGWGSYVSWRLYPNIKVSMDGRYETTYPESTFDLNNAFYDHQGDWLRLCRQYKVDYVILDLQTEQLRPGPLEAAGYILITNVENVSALLCLPEHAALLQKTARDLPPITEDPLDEREEGPMMTDGKAPSRRDAFFAAVVIGAVFATLTLKTWRRWPDLVVDFGAQLYMPWQISTGAVLYRDVHYLAGGPLSQYYHALLFKIFGVSFLTLVVSNLVVLALLLAVMYFCFFQCSDQLTAITVCVAVLVVFAFAHYTTMGIFNYITPYSAEVVHGLVLSVLAVVLLARWFETEKLKWAAAAGFCAGLTFLTKPDLFLALALTVTSAAALFWQARHKMKFLARSLVVMTGAGAVPSAAFFLWFFRVENFPQSIRSVLAAWIPLLTTPAAHNPFYRWCLGLDMPEAHLLQTILQFLGLAVVAAVCGLLCWRKIPRLAAVILVAACALVLIKVSWEFNWFNCGHCLPLVCLALLALLVWRGATSGWEPSVVFAFLWTLWSLALLAKLGFFCRIWHYGFALAMPAFASGLYLLLWALPRQLESYGLRVCLFRGLLCCLLLPGLTRLTQSSVKLYSEKTLPVGSGPDTILVFDPHFRPVDAEVAAALHWVESNAPPRATLAVLPQGAMLNFLSRHPNPCGYMAWNPPEMAAFGQEKMTTAFIASRPDYVIELFVNYGEYGENIFGREKRFGRDAQEWIDSHYEIVQSIGHDWLKDGQFGLKILKRRTPE